jgi:NAD(P)-dependent dehydrogenase (short-subunit alcohol dehydrogenase family)
MDLQGRVCLVTGGTAGIGYAAATELARRGGIVVLVGRSAERCEAAARSIQERTGNQRVEGLAADLSSQAEVRRLVGAFKARHDRLHVLVNNAGALYELRTESVDGIEMTLALNHLAPFLLTNLLLDMLRASAPSRIVNVSSDSHEMVKGFDFEDPQARGKQAGQPRYGRSRAASALWTFLLPRGHPALLQYARTKLANLLFTRELARRLKGTGVSVYAMHPGFVASSFSTGNGAYGWFMRLWTRLFAITAEEGASTVVHLAASPEVKGESGGYFVKERPATPSAAALDDHAATRLWELSEELTGLGQTDLDGNP